MKLNLYAPAKVNLALHIIGRRTDGYHLLESLVVFPDIVDHLTFENAPDFSLVLDGPYIDGLINLNQQDHIIKIALDKFSQTQQITNQGVRIHLTKNLPISSGIGGGSSDAATTLLALNQLWQCHLQQEALEKIAIMIGADVPVCLTKKPTIISGIGEKLSNLSSFPSGAIVLVNSNKLLSTPKVFANLKNSQNAALPEISDNFSDFSTLMNWLSKTRNDLESSAIELEPEIQTIKLELLNQKHCEIARMSGSGATYFGLFQNYEDAQQACQNLQKKYPNWWIKAGKF